MSAHIFAANWIDQKKEKVQKAFSSDFIHLIFFFCCMWKIIIIKNQMDQPVVRLLIQLEYNQNTAQFAYYIVWMHLRIEHIAKWTYKRNWRKIWKKNTEFKYLMQSEINSDKIFKFSSYIFYIFFICVVYSV